MSPSRAACRLVAVVLLASGIACASVPLPSPAVMAEARATVTYSGSLRVSLDGPQFRGRTRVLLGFRRPDALRIEIPGPTGPRLVAVTKDGGLTAVFPGDRAIFRGRATAAELESLLGVGLAPEELIDLLVGAPSPRLRSYEARWSRALPRDIEAVLPDGTRLRAKVDDSETGLDLRDEAFEAPRHEAFREVDAAEARRLWGGR
ncbi:MAG: hypothetical protein ACHQKZ_09705 [Solirubrobacterales bacterium]|jgi:hypothetical protein